MAPIMRFFDYKRLGWPARVAVVGFASTIGLCLSMWVFGAFGSDQVSKDGLDLEPIGLRCPSATALIKQARAKEAVERDSGAALYSIASDALARCAGVERDVLRSQEDALDSAIARVSAGGKTPDGKAQAYSQAEETIKPLAFSSFPSIRNAAMDLHFRLVAAGMPGSL